VTSHNLKVLPRAALPCRLTPTCLLRYQSPLRTVVVPESTQRLPRHHLPHVHAYEPHYEHTVPAQIVFRELSEDTRLSVGRVHSPELSPHVLDLPGPVEGPEEPLEGVDDVSEGEEHKPKPEKNEDLLIEEVDCERTLNDVGVDTGLVADTKLTECDAGEHGRLLGEVLSSDQLVYDVDTVHVIVCVKKCVQHEQVTDSVGEVESLDDQIRRDEIVTIKTSTHQAAYLQHMR